MTGISWRANVDDDDMREKLSQLVEQMRRPEGFYRRVGEHLLNSVSDNFRNEESPDGKKWAPLSPVTVERRGSSGPILKVSGELSSVNAQVTDSEVRIGSALIYAAIQHKGGSPNGYMKGAVIPARPYLGMGRDDEEEILAIAEEQFSIE